VKKGLLFAVLAAAVSLPMTARGADEAAQAGPRTAFFEANAAYRQGDFPEAVRRYEQLLVSGVQSGNLYFNLGNAYFKLGDNGRAILNYVRARRFLPRDPDVQANLSYALSLGGADICEVEWWEELLFPLASRVPTAPLVVAATLLYTLLLLALAARRLIPGRPRWLSYVALTAAAALLLTAGSLLHRVTGLEWRRQAVVIAAGDTAARFEPAETGTVHFVLNQGEQVELNAEREGWRQVSRCDGRRGWIAAESVEETFATMSVSFPTG
jgi:tetratricopeptide (TPR) repeat protein